MGHSIPKLTQKIAENTANVVADKIEKIKEPFSISGFLGIKQKIREIAEDLHHQALLTPSPEDDHIDYLDLLYNNPHLGFTKYAPDWIKDIVIYTTATLGDLSHNLVQGIFKMTYSLLTNVVIWTPEWIFADAWFPESIAQFTVISLLILILGIMIQGIKRMLRMPFTKVREILKRIPIALLVTGLTPLLFTTGARWLNDISHYIMDIAKIEIGNDQILGFSPASFIFEPMNIVMMIAFLVLAGYMCIPLFLFHGRRWFLLLCNAALTPFAMAAYVFDDTRRYFEAWLDTIKTIGKQQLIFSAFISLIGLLMFATPNPTTLSGIFSKGLIMIGGIHTLAYPPQMVRGISEKSWIGVYDDLNRKRKGIQEDWLGDGKDNKGYVGNAKKLVGGIKNLFTKPPSKGEE